MSSAPSNGLERCRSCPGCAAVRDRDEQVEGVHPRSACSGCSGVVEQRPELRPEVVLEVRPKAGSPEWMAVARPRFEQAATSRRTDLRPPGSSVERRRTPTAYALHPGRTRLIISGSDDPPGLWNDSDAIDAADDHGGLVRRRGFTRLRRCRPRRRIRPSVRPAEAARVPQLGLPPPRGPRRARRRGCSGSWRAVLGRGR